MLKAKISPSMMCADFLNLKENIKELEEAKVEYLHIDIMDGVFVPNITLSNDITKQIRKVTNIPFDYHLMITNPYDKINWFDIKENDLVSIHIEAETRINDFVNLIHEKKALAGLAISPDTNEQKVYPYLSNLDFIVVMTVYPGFAGQKVVVKTLEKIKNLRNYLDKNNYQQISIEVDGNVSFENAIIMSKNGANIFVGGSSSVFNKDFSIIKGVNKLRKVITDGE